MDTRHPIQDNREPTVLSVAFNHDRRRLVCGMSNGIRIFRSKDCLRTIKQAPSPGHGVAIAESLDDRIMAVVGGGRLPNSSPEKIEFLDVLHNKKLSELDLSEPILGIRMTSKLFLIILIDRTVCLEYKSLSGKDSCAPGNVRGLYNTTSNPYALCCVSGDTIVLPGLTSGQVQIMRLSDKSKKIIPAHSSSLRQIALSDDGEILATASEQGTLIRVFSTRSPTPTHEFRRGVESAAIFGLAISPNNHFIASTSDKGTLHIFDLRQPEEPQNPTIRKRTSLSRSSAAPYAHPNSADLENTSQPSGSSTPLNAAGFYSPPPDIAHTPPSNAPSAFAALAKLPGMPRAFRDARSMTSIPYHLGSDPPNWQGQPAYTATTLPNGQTTKVKNPNVPVPGRPDGKPPKGVVAWDPDGGDRRLWVVGGGADARWEVFELAEEAGGRMRVFKTGFRRYLTRQFPENQ